MNLAIQEVCQCDVGCSVDGLPVVPRRVVRAAVLHPGSYVALRSGAEQCADNAGFMRSALQGRPLIGGVFDFWKRVRTKSSSFLAALGMLTRAEWKSAWMGICVESKSRTCFCFGRVWDLVQAEGRGACHEGMVAVAQTLKG